jgi:hypothetical protein
MLAVRCLDDVANFGVILLNLGNLYFSARNCRTDCFNSRDAYICLRNNSIPAR